MFSGRWALLAILENYQSAGAAGRTSGSQNAATTFALAPGDTHPQGIADPPAPGTFLAAGESPMTETAPLAVQPAPDMGATPSLESISLPPGLVSWLPPTKPVASMSWSDAGQPGFQADFAPQTEVPLPGRLRGMETLRPGLMPKGTPVSPHRALDQVFSDPALGLIGGEVLGLAMAGV